MIGISDYLWNSSKYPPKPVCAVFGDDSFLRSHALHTLRDKVLFADESEFSFSRFEGNSSGIKDILKEVSTQSMFRASKRFVLVEEADSFVSKYRENLEKYAQNPSESAVLVLQLRTFAASTRLYKEIDKSGLIIEAKASSEKEMKQWIAQWSKHQYKTECLPEAAELILQRVGTEHGLIDQELTKLSLSVKQGEPITVKLVEENVGAWRTLTVFQMLDFALEGKGADAVRELDKLLLSGEQPIQILGAITSSLRKFAAATVMILDAEKQKRKLPIDIALGNAGMNPYFVGKAKGQMVKLGRYRGMKLYKQLLSIDLALKGDSRTAPWILLEKLILWIANERLRSTG